MQEDKIHQIIEILKEQSLQQKEIISLLEQLIVKKQTMKPTQKNTEKQTNILEFYKQCNQNEDILKSRLKELSKMHLTNIIKKRYTNFNSNRKTTNELIDIVVQIIKEESNIYNIYTDTNI